MPEAIKAYLVSFLKNIQVWHHPNRLHPGNWSVSLGYGFDPCRHLSRHRRKGLLFLDLQDRRWRLETLPYSLVDDPRTNQVSSKRRINAIGLELLGSGLFCGYFRVARTTTLTMVSRATHSTPASDSRPSFRAIRSSFTWPVMVATLPEMAIVKGRGTR